MEFPKFVKWYRVLEVRRDGKTTFFPQERHQYWVWKSIIRKNYEYLKEEFHTIEQAEEFLYHFEQTQHKRDIAEKVKQKEAKFNKVIRHPFNAVFYKLKKTK